MKAILINADRTLFKEGITVTIVPREDWDSMAKRLFWDDPDARIITDGKKNQMVEADDLEIIEEDE